MGDTIPVNYSVDGGSVTGENAIMTALVYPDSTFRYTFTATTDMSAIKSYSFESYTGLAYDDTTSNDTLTSIVVVQGLTQIDLGSDTIVRALEWTLDAGPGYDSYLWQDNSTSQTFVADTTGWYRVTVTEGTKCENSDSLYLTMVVPDLGLDRIHSPVTACGLSASESLSLYVYNVGTDTLTASDTIPVTYRVNAGSFVDDTLFVGSEILPGDSILFTSTGTIDMSSAGTYTILVASLITVVPS